MEINLFKDENPHKKLILRDLEYSDAKSITENANNIKVSQWLLVVPFPYKIKDAKSWIKSTKEDAKKRVKKDCIFGIELKEEKRIIGAMGIHKVNMEQGKAKVGYWLGENYWRFGYGCEALEKENKIMPEMFKIYFFHNTTKKRKNRP